MIILFYLKYEFLFKQAYFLGVTGIIGRLVLFKFENVSVLCDNGSCKGGRFQVCLSWS